MKRSPVRKKRAGPPRRGRVIDADYKAFIAEKPCLVCADMQKYYGEVVLQVQQSKTEVAHVGVRGLSQKSSDRETIPCCSHHHRLLPTSIHVIGRKAFEVRYGINIDEAIKKYQAEYDSISGYHHSVVD